MHDSGTNNLLGLNYYSCGTVNGYHRHKRNKEEPCDECYEGMRKFWRDARANPERVQHINKLRRAWRRRTPNANRNRMHRVKAAGGIEGYYSDEQVLELYGTNCHICGEPIDLTANRQCGKDGWEKALHIDHVIPLSKGGADSIENVRPSHGQCNIKKWAKL